MTELIRWRDGHFEVEGVLTEVPPHAEFPEIQKRLEGRTIAAIQEYMDAYFLQLDDGQVVEFSGIWCNDSTADTGVRFWREASDEGKA